MPVEIRDLDGGLGNLVLGSDALDDKEFLGTIRKHLMQDETKFMKYRYSICDWTQSTQINLSNDAIYELADLCKTASLVNPDIIVGGVAKSDVVFGLSRMAQILMDEDGWEYEVFRNREDAEEWIKAKVKEKYGIDDLTMV